MKQYQTYNISKKIPLYSMIKRSKKQKQIEWILLFWLIYWIISPTWPRITTENSPYSFQNSENNPFFFDSFYRIITTWRNMFTIRGTIEWTCPEWMIRRKVSLVSLQDGENDILKKWMYMRYYFHMRDGKIRDSSSWRKIFLSFPWLDSIYSSISFWKSAS